MRGKKSRSLRRTARKVRIEAGLKPTSKRRVYSLLKNLNAKRNASGVLVIPRSELERIRKEEDHGATE